MYASGSMEKMQGLPNRMLAISRWYPAPLWALMPFFTQGSGQTEKEIRWVTVFAGV